LQVLDSKVVSELREMLDDEVDELFDELIQIVPQTLATMTECAASGDLKSIEEKAHLIKGSASNLGVMVFAEACRQLEEGLRAGDISEPAAHLLILNDTFAQAVVEIKAMAEL